MVSTKVNPLSPEDIEEIDHLVGKFFLVWELFQIEEFVALWWPALERQERAMQGSHFPLHPSANSSRSFFGKTSGA